MSVTTFKHLETTKIFVSNPDILSHMKASITFMKSLKHQQLKAQFEMDQIKEEFSKMETIQRREKSKLTIPLIEKVAQLEKNQEDMKSQLTSMQDSPELIVVILAGDDDAKKREKIAKEMLTTEISVEER